MKIEAGMNSAGHVRIRPDSRPDTRPRAIQNFSKILPNPAGNPASFWPDSWPDSVLFIPAKFFPSPFEMRLNPKSIQSSTKHIYTLKFNFYNHSGMPKTIYHEYTYSVCQSKKMNPIHNRVSFNKLNKSHLH